jgi:dTDP-4-amino-4,6-dideoxygalactose transaminase
VFSNNLRKPVPAGSGGIAVTNDASLAERFREFRDALPRRTAVNEAVLRVEMWTHTHILRPRLYWPLYELQMKVRGHHAPRSLTEQIAAEVQRLAQRASDYQMRIGLQWLREIDTIVAHRRLCAEEYAAALSTVDGITLPCLASPQPLYYFPVLVDDKDALLREARRQRVELIAWPVRTPIYPIERHEELAQLGYERGSNPVAEDVARRLVGLPTDLATQAPQRATLVQLLRRHHVSGQ